MPEIGPTLREARMRARIDVSELEALTKIRAKYLRALENEEWELLPGPTYVKSFLRTYAEALDLDAKLLVDEYKLRHEHLNEVELQPINARAPGRGRRRTGPVVPRSVVVGAIFALLLLALYTLGRNSNDNPSGGATPAPTQATSQTGPAAEAPPLPPRTRAASVPRVRLRIVATDQVYVCLKTPDKTLVDGRTLQAGQRTATYRSQRFRLTLGNANALLIVNGHERRVPASSTPIGMEITKRHGRRALSEKERPSCR